MNHLQSYNVVPRASSRRERNAKKLLILQIALGTTAAVLAPFKSSGE